MCFLRGVSVVEPVLESGSVLRAGSVVVCLEEVDFVGGLTVKPLMSKAGPSRYCLPRLGWDDEFGLNRGILCNPCRTRDISVSVNV